MKKTKIVSINNNTAQVHKENKTECYEHFQSMVLNEYSKTYPLERF